MFVAAPHQRAYSQQHARILTQAGRQARKQANTQFELDRLLLV